MRTTTPFKGIISTQKKNKTTSGDIFAEAQNKMNFLRADSRT